MEIWKDIEGLDGYRVSSLGKVRGTKRVLKQRATEKGYFEVGVRGRSLRIHRLVAIAFIPNPENKKEVNHKNGIKSDNRVENLEWNTRRENTTHAKINGLAPRGTRQHLNKLTEENVIEIKRVLNRKFKYGEKKVVVDKLCEKYGVAFGTIDGIYKGWSWGWLKG